MSAACRGREGVKYLKLDMDCVRDVLLCVEENTDLRSSCIFVDIELNKKLAQSGMQAADEKGYQQDLMNWYTNNELIYHVRYCVEAGLIVRVAQSGCGSHIYLISDLTPKGHEFLANIRSKDNWEKTKSIGTKIGSFGLEMVKKISEGVATAALNKLLGLS